MTDKMKNSVDLLIRSIETGDPAPASVINDEHYIQHNLEVADGLAAFGALLGKLPKGVTRAKPARIFRDGEYVFSHTDYDFFGPKIGFDIFRFNNGKIVEHWDNLQATPENANPSGRSMIDGPTSATDIGKTDVNKSLVSAFVEDVLVKGRVEYMAQYFAGDGFIQHNPMVGDGVSGLGEALTTMAAAGMPMVYEQLHHVFGEGNFVLAVSEGRFAGRHVAFYDLFRVEDGKLAEHWDVIQDIPEAKLWQNQNGKF